VVAIVTSPDRLESWALPVDGGIAPEAVQRIADEMVTSGKLSQPISAKDILRDDAVKQAYREISSRSELRTAISIALAAQEKYGF
jgi:polyhydroxyalkanoate synthesis regulator phasin